MRPILVPAAIAVLLLTGVVIWSRTNSSTYQEQLTKAEAAAAIGDIQTAERLVSQILREDPDHGRALVLSAKCLNARNQPVQAVKLLSGLAQKDSPESVDAACLAGDLLFFRLYRPQQAARQYRQALQHDPASIEANDRLAILLGVTGQWWQQVPVRLATLKFDRFSFMDLVVLALGDKALLNPELAQAMAGTSLDDPLVLLAAARLAVEEEQHDQAIQLLIQAVAKDSSLIQAQVLLGSQYFHLGDQTRFSEWLSQLPTGADQHPGIWILRGKWAQQSGDVNVALRCFCEAVQQDPNHPDSLYQAGTILQAMGRHQDATPFFKRATELNSFVNAVKAADSDSAVAETMRAAELAESLGNYWEAWGWTSVAIQRQAKPEWSQQMTLRIKPLLRGLSLQRTHPDHNPAHTCNYQQLPAFSTLSLSPELQTTPSIPDEAVKIAFHDQAQSAGICFQYFNGSQDVLKGTRNMYEVMGGGIAVLDVNGDDLPDLFLTQGCPWQERGRKHEFLDRLFLNSRYGTFTDVTHESGIFETNFSQGAAVGDVDSDGFPDIVVANIGQNRLFRNNGDGTFHEMTHQAGFQGADWTTSVAIADLSGDGHPEIVFANYLEGSDVFSRTCGPQNDRVCLPQHFPAAGNRLFWNLGDEQFQDVTESSGMDVAHGKSLGLVVGSFGSSSGLDLFVANDTVSNFYFRNQGSVPQGAPRFQEMAMVSGLALNAEGTAQACMGVAAGDADADGHTDLFVTNFHGESNTLYRQLGNGSFEDAALRFGLRQPSLSKLGFGTQFLDADLDGQLDLVVANGHIDHFSQDGRTEYQMQPQVFHNLGPEGFREVDSNTLGPYFKSKKLGRSLARMDWNADGKEDVVVMHLDAPVALLENRSQISGNYLVVTLKGLESSRDAIGAVVQVQTENLLLTRQLTAGDGFQASNQRILTFGLGNDKTVQKLSVTWPSGQVSNFAALPANSRWTVIEGKDCAYPSPDDK